MHRLLLAAVQLKLKHPISGAVLNLEAPITGVMKQFCSEYFFNGDQSFESKLIQRTDGLMSQCSCLKDLSDFRHLLASS